MKYENIAVEYKNIVVVNNHRFVRAIEIPIKFEF